MRVEHFRQWLIATTWYYTPDATNWKKFVAIMQVAFRYCNLVKESMWQTVVLIPKGTSGDLRGV